MGGAGAMSTALTAGKVISQLTSGVASMSAGRAQQAQYNNEADAQLREGEILANESYQSAEQKAREATKFQSEQANQYASSGVTLEGSPILVLAETRRLAQQEVDALRSRAEAQKQIASIRAAGVRAAGTAAASAGRNALFGSILTAGGTAAESYISGKRLGIYGNASSNPLAPATTTVRSY